MPNVWSIEEEKEYRFTVSGVPADAPVCGVKVKVPTTSLFGVDGVAPAPAAPVGPAGPTAPVAPRGPLAPGGPGGPTTFHCTAVSSSWQSVALDTRRRLPLWFAHAINVLVLEVDAEASEAVAAAPPIITIATVVAASDRLG